LWLILYSLLQGVNPEIESFETEVIPEKIDELRKTEDLIKKIRFSSDLLMEINEKLKEIENKKVCLLQLTQEIQRIANEAIRQASETRLEKKMLYNILGPSEAPSPGILSVKLDIRERTVEDVLKGLEKRGLIKKKV